MEQHTNGANGSPVKQDRNAIGGESVLDRHRTRSTERSGGNGAADKQPDKLRETLSGKPAQVNANGRDKPVFDCKARGVSYKSWRVLKWGLDLLEIEARYNLRSGRLELAVDCNPRLNFRIPKYAPGWNPATAELHAWIRDEIHERYLFRGPGKNSYNVSLQWTKEKYYETLDALGGQPALRIDPLREYLDLLEWDNTRRLDTIMADLFGCEQSDKSAWFGLYLFGGVVKRTIDPGAKLDGIPILAGPQGIGKSSFLAYMLPPDMQQSLFTGSVNLLDRDKETIGLCRGRAVIECGELAGIHGRALDLLKQFVALPFDSFRKPYGRDWHDVPRTWIIVGTADKRDRVIPHDPEGNRRWPFIWLPGGNMSRAGRIAMLDELREQLWAEAYYRVYVEREPVYWTDALQAQYGDEHKRHERGDEILTEAVHALDEAPNFPGYDSLAGFAERLNMSDNGLLIRQGDQSRLVDALKSCGYEHGGELRRVDSRGVRSRIWRKIQTVPLHHPIPAVSPSNPVNSDAENAQNKAQKRALTRGNCRDGMVGGTVDGTLPKSRTCATCGLNGPENGRAPCLARHNTRTPDCTWK